jgi:uncharacterized membrane protein YdcZ (DUF606 family)
VHPPVYMRVRFAMVSFEFFIGIIILVALWRLGWQPLTEMSTRSTFCVGKDDRCVELTTLPPLYDNCLEIWEPQPPGGLTVCSGLQLVCFTLIHQYKNSRINKSTKAVFYSMCCNYMQAVLLIIVCFKQLHMKFQCNIILLRLSLLNCHCYII